MMEQLLDLLLDNFQLNFGQLSDAAKQRLKTNASQLWFRYICDFFISSFIIAPCVISFWRGVWDYSAIYLQERYFNGDCYKTNLTCLVIGCIGVFLIQYNHETIRTHLANFKATSCPSSVRRTGRFVVISRLFSVFWGFVDIYYWKAVWDGVDCYFGKSIETGTATLILGLMVLAAFKSLRSASSVPAGFTLDDVANCCHANTFLQTKNTDPFFKRILDTSGSVFLEFFVILIWHGLWSLLDGYSEEYGVEMYSATSAYFSLWVGILSNVFVFTLQFGYSYYVKTMPDKCIKSWILAYIFGTLFSMLCIFSSVNTFRGYWYILDVYFHADSVYESSLIHGQIYAALLLIILHAGCSLHAGIFTDVSPEAGGNMIEYYYSSYFYIKDTEAQFGNTLMIRQNKIRHPNSLPLLVITEVPSQDTMDEPAQVENGYLSSEPS